MKRMHTTLMLAALTCLMLTLSGPTLANEQDEMKVVITEFYQALVDGRTDDLMQMIYVPSIELAATQSTMPAVKSVEVIEANSGKGYAPAAFNNFHQVRDKVHQVRYKITFDNGKTHETDINLIKQDGKWLVIAD